MFRYRGLDRFDRVVCTFFRNHDFDILFDFDLTSHANLFRLFSVVQQRQFGRQQRADAICHFAFAIAARPAPAAGRRQKNFFAG